MIRSAPQYPASIEAERIVLGSAINYPDLMQAARPVIEPEFFSIQRHRDIWKQACALYDSGRAIDQASVYLLLEQAAGRATDDFSYLIDLDRGLPQFPNIENYIAVLHEKASLRRILDHADHAMKRCMAGDKSKAIADGLQEGLAGLEPKTAGKGLRSAADLVADLGITRLLAPRKERGLMTPWAWMNHSTCGMLPAELWVLAAHTSNGKTSAMLQHAVNAARHGTGVAIFSLEVSEISLFQKACCQLARVSSENFRRGRLNPDELRAINEAATEIHDLPLYFDTTSTTVMGMHAALRQRTLKNKVNHVIVDYLQLLGNSGRYDNRAQAVGANAWACKMLATDFQVPVLLLSQFNRESAKPGKNGEAPREPVLADLKESGDIENHASGVWFIHRETMEDLETVPVQFMLPKQRDGRRNIRKGLVFLPRYQRFEELTTEDWSDR